MLSADCLSYLIVQCLCFSKMARTRQQRAKTSTRKKGRALNKWSEASMAAAIKEYVARRAANSANVGLREIARTYNVPTSTLERRVKGKVHGSSHASGRPTVLTVAEEKELTEHIQSLARRGFPLAEKQVRELATEYAERNGLAIFSNSKQKQAGYYWLRGFLKRHPELKVKRAEGLSIARAQAMNKEKIQHWFSQYEKLLTECNIVDVPSHIWNLDESGLQDYFVSKRAVGETGIPLHQVTAGDRAETTTVLPVFNAVGVVAVLMIIFKGTRLKAEWRVDMPSGAMLTCSKDGWINKELFLDFGKKFVESLPKVAGRKHVLLLDGHGSHTYNFEFLKLMADNNVEVMCFPPHTSHCLQPADKSLFKSLKTHWTLEGLQYTRDHGGVKVGKKNFFKVFSPAWQKSATVENLQSGFRATGMFPVNSRAIPEVAYLPSMTTEQLPDTDPHQNVEVRPAETTQALLVNSPTDTVVDQVQPIEQSLLVQQGPTDEPMVIAYLTLPQIQQLGLHLITEAFLTSTQV